MVLTLYWDDIRRQLAEVTSPIFRFGFEHEEGKNWFRFVGPETTVQFHGAGLGDEMIIYQCGQAFGEYVTENGDPGLGEIVISCGAMKPCLYPDEGDVNAYWWWSFGNYDDRPDEWLDHYLAEVAVEPEIILCPSERTQEEADQRGFESLYLPLATGPGFQPLGFDRSGFGYAGTRGHKAPSKERKVIEPTQSTNDFEWVESFHRPSQLNLWYNTKLATVGMTREGQRSWGMVNNRVFETLASGTPFILESHPTVESVLGFKFPYQTSSRSETEELLTRIQDHPEVVLADFQGFSCRIRAEHTYMDRMETLLNKLM